MADLLERQEQIQQQIESSLVNFKKDGAARKTIEYFETRTNKLNQFWTEFEFNHDRITTEQSPNIPYFSKKVYESTKQIYLALKTLYNQGYQQLLADQNAAGSSSGNEGSTSGAGGTHQPQPPPRQEGPGPSQGRQDRGTNSRLDEMYRKQNSNIKAFVRTANNIDLELLTEKWELEDALKSLEIRWSVVDSMHWIIDGETDDLDYVYVCNFNTQEKVFNQLKRWINKKIWSVAHREKSTPQLDIPIFNGNYNTWVSFKDLFNEAIHNNTSLSSAQKMQFLKSKVKGEAEKLIQHLQISSDNYSVCWEILNNRYNNTKLIFTSHMNILFGLPNIQQQSVTQIKKLHDVSTECLHAIKNLGVDISTWDPILVYILSQKLDTETYTDYVESLPNPRELPNLELFLGYLESKFTTLESSRRKVEPSNPKSNIQHPSTSNFKKSFQNYPQNYNNRYNYNQFNHKNYENSRNYGHQPVAKSMHISGGIKCPLCKNAHGIYNCRYFLQMPVEKRLLEINRLALCINCLFTHNGNACNSTKTCHKCGGQHSTLLHEACIKNTTGSRTQSASPSTASTSGTKRQQEHVTSTSHASQDEQSEILLATALVKVQTSNNTFHILRALIDQGSQISLITEQAAQLLNLKRERCAGVIYGVGQRENNCKGKLSIICHSLYNDFKFNTEVIIMNNLIKSLPNKTFNKPNWSIIQNINLADPEFYISRPVDLLLGADVYSNILLGGLIKSEDITQPMAQQTQLGWLLCGSAKTYHCNVIINSLEDIKQFWEVEDITEDSDLSNEELLCVKHYQETTYRRSDGRYEVRLPMKQHFEEELGTSRTKAIAQFRNMERKFEKQHSLALAYKTFMKEYSDLEHMKKSECNMTPEYYLPHHGVERLESTTTKYRVVFNASAKTSTGRSLNDLMYTGPNLQQDLQTLLLRWRQYEYAFTADIEKMYRQILVNKHDQHLQKIIWRESPEQPLETFQLMTVTYGLKAAPFLAMMTLRRLAADEKHNYPEAAKVVEEAFYMDDLVHGSYSIEQGQKLISNLNKLLTSGGFNLRKWSSNNNQLLDNIENKQENQDMIFNFKTDNISKTLGLRWNPTTDQFSFKFTINKNINILTKRSLLSEISKLFDPLGWLSPITTKLKILFKKVWKLKTQWDEPVSNDIYVEWSKVQADIERISEYEIPRWIQCKQYDVIELHGFCDASMDAYACVVYARIRNKKNIVLVAAKSRLVPHKKMLTLPRLELSGAYLLSKLITKIKQNLQQHEIITFGWTDSKIVLGWLQGEPNRWKPFVANRVKQIIDSMPEKQWNYVKSSDNPADAASRGLTASQLTEHSLWWQGPDWLPTFKSEAEITEKQTYYTEEEARRTYVSNTAQSETENIIQTLLEKHSSFAKVTRLVAWILRAFTPQRRQRNLPTYLTLQELQKAKLVIIKYAQTNEWKTEIDYLRTHGKVSSKSSLLNLNPFIDSENILRVGGRLKEALISYEMKHPKIIPKDSRLASLLIDQAHQQTFHGGPQLTMAKLRQEYWITGGNNIVKKQLRNCVTCRRNEGRTQQQLMGDLPAPRVNQASPFYHTGVDYTGFVEVKANKGRGIKTLKGYIAIFICMVTKAVHLELVSELTSSAFLAALRRMAARRGTPRHLYSDNGTNFIKANRILQEQWQHLKETFNDTFLKEITEMNIEWHFNAPSWPSAGGLWERAVRSLKHHLKRVVGEQKLTYEEYTTILAQLEACLNSRPLCPLTENVEDLDFLTPAHFLTGRTGVTVIETEEDARCRWHLTQKLFNDIWKKWKMEYLSQLTARRKWQSPQQNIVEGDMVIIQEENLPPGKWALGRVIEVHPGADGYVRVVTLKTKNGILKRPVVKLSILPLNTPKESNVRQNKQDFEDKRNGRGNQNSKSTLFTTLLMLIYLFTIFTSANSLKVTPLNSSQGFYFDKLSKMQVIRDDWKLVAYYDLEPYWEGISAYKKYNKQLEAICEEVNTLSHCDVIMAQLRHSYDELQHYNNILLRHQLKQRSRHRRGIINGVGYLANTLFGVLDDRFAEQYQKDINLIQKNERHLKTLLKNQTSIIEAEYNLLQRTQETIQKQHKMINQHLINLEKSTNTMKVEVTKAECMAQFTISAMAVNNLLSNLRNTQNTILEIITNIYNGKMNIHIIDPRQLQRELNIISGQLLNDLTLPINNFETNLESIYHLLRIKARITDQFLIFEIRIPLISRDSYDIYNILSIPHSSGRNMISIIPITQYVAINLQKDSYLLITEKELEQCVMQDETTYLCYLTSPIFKMTSDLDLCVKHENQTNECKTTITTCQSKWIGLSKINKYLQFCCNDCKLRIICKDQVTTRTLTNTNIISLQENCIVKTENFTVHTHSNIESKIYISSSVEVPEIEPINNIINVSIPKFIQNKTEEETEYREQRSDLKKIGDNIKNIKESQNQRLSEDFSIHDVHHYVSIYSLWGAAILAAVVCVWCRVHRRRRAAATAASPAEPRRAARERQAPPAAAARHRPPRPPRPNEDTPDSVQVQTVSVQQCSEIEMKECRSKDKGTSPILRKFTFSKF